MPYRCTAEFCDARYTEVSEGGSCKVCNELLDEIALKWTPAMEPKVLGSYLLVPRSALNKEQKKEQKAKAEQEKKERAEKKKNKNVPLGRLRSNGVVERPRGLLLNAPLEDESERPQAVSDRVQQWIGFIGNYDAQTRIETPEQVIVRDSLPMSELFSSRALMKLHEGAGSSIAARRVFLLAFALHIPSLKMQSLLDNRGRAIKLADLVGKRNVGAYKAAIEEEKNSKEYREAVVRAGVKTYSGLGLTWTKPKHLVVGGSSGAGKTFGSKTIFKALQKHSSDETLRHFFFTGNSREPAVKYIVSVDGGDARATSQIRSIVLQCALALGYKGISDLHSNTEGLDIKNKIKAAAFHPESRVHVVEPRTFSNFLQETYSKIVVDPARVVFCMVETDPGVIRLQGESRAWYDYQRNAPPSPDYIQLNNEKVGCESKEYSDGGLSWGFARSESARAGYVTHTRKKGVAPLAVVLKNNSVVKGNTVSYAINPDVTIAYSKLGTKSVFGTGGNKTLMFDELSIRELKFDPNKTTQK
jgi:hypothetical protein